MYLKTQTRLIALSVFFVFLNFCNYLSMLAALTAGFAEGLIVILYAFLKAGQQNRRKRIKNIEPK